MSSQAEIAFAIGGYATCSSLMLIMNKVAVHVLPAPSLVLLLQLLASAWATWLAGVVGLIVVDPLDWTKVKAFIPVAGAFLAAVFTNMKTLQFANVETFIVFRASTPILISVCDWAFLGRELPTARSWASLGSLVIGAILYVATDAQVRPARGEGGFARRPTDRSVGSIVGMPSRRRMATRENRGGGRRPASLKHTMPRLHDTHPTPPASVLPFSRVRRFPLGGVAVGDTQHVSSQWGAEFGTLVPRVGLLLGVHLVLRVLLRPGGRAGDGEESALWCCCPSRGLPPAPATARA
jgi:hypothetical protein